MVPNPDKVREAIVHIIAEADRRHILVTQYDILKSMFFADRAHLNKYGRPITFDEYVAMPDGPVPSLAYNVLKEEPPALREVGLDAVLWKVMAGGGKKKYYSAAQREASDEVLSESDIEELDVALTHVKRLGFAGVWRETHRDPAYMAAWRDDPERRQFPMDYALLYERPNPQAAEELKFYASL
ncbi:Panacea domain-containing protein [Phenylobacterium sp. LH3H17]|uniref:type II toxin-antitoxin system antitoxin SocA domain-containing protein n=1 Tax=Phenylobacterium sp. LH3H17 TaxID=2903901 RepID=UPI0020C99A7F|nr:Panacea domain-containing protein [Phenylobacterium sp. LH3H17]UTP39807.1 Panacea domain-containing protein [Phenylobacterium sp. LH3H17]